MEDKRSNAEVSGLKILKWAFLVFFIIVTSFAILYGIHMHAMQKSIISEIVKCMDPDEFYKTFSIDRKGIVLNHYFLFYSFIISVCGLIAIIIFLSISLRITKKKLELKHNQAIAADVKDHAAEA
jgi:hypothetical protein